MAEPLRYLDHVLGLTAFAAGAVDIISFARLGGILASAMTGNVAFLAFYISRLALASAIGSAIALAAFIGGGAAGTLLARNRDQAASLRIMLATETCLLAAAVVLWLPTAHRNGSASCDGLIILLATAMGLQSIIGKRINLSNIPTIVFTSTLINIVIGVTDALANRDFSISADTRRQFASLMLYFAGALAAGIAVALHAAVLIFLPAAAITTALILQQGRHVNA